MNVLFLLLEIKAGPNFADQKRQARRIHSLNHHSENIPFFCHLDDPWNG